MRELEGGGQMITDGDGEEDELRTPPGLLVPLHRFLHLLGVQIHPVKKKSVRS